MISEDLREWIEPQLKMHLPREDYGYIDEMFSEVYVINVDGMDRVCLKPTPRSKDISMRFLALNGGFDGDAYWDDVKTKGRLL